MITVRVTTEITDDRRVIVTLPPEVPTGKAELVVTVESSSALPRGVPAAQIRGIAAGNGPPPDDAMIEQWLEERRKEKYE